MVRVACIILLHSVVAACALAKPPPPAPLRHADLGLSIKSVTLANGLRVVLVKDPHASEVQVTMRYRVGSADDLEHPGIAHLVEHLMFQQTLGSQTLFAQLEDNATFFNGFTTYDATTYLSRARPELLDKLLSIEAVRLGFRCTSITDSAFEREREVVMQELKLKNEAFDVLASVYRAVYPNGHPYAAPRDSVQTVAEITRSEACAFADSYYATSNAALVISGNLSPERVEAALGKFLARIAKRVASSPGPVPEATKLSPHDASAPIDRDALLVTWPLPLDPSAQIGLRALLKATAGGIDSQLKGSAAYIELGDVRAPVIGIVIEPARDESVQDVLGKVQDTFEELPDDLENYLPDVSFDALRQRTIYEQFASLEDGSGRDIRLAAHVLAGRDASDALNAEMRALRELGRRQAAELTRRYLAFDAATLVTLKATANKKTGQALAVRPAVHDMGQRRSVPDIARAHEPDQTINVPSLAVETRVLPNGLKVVLLPLSTVPTIDARLVFDAGTGDDAANKRGAAMLAAYALEMDLHHVNDAFNFLVAGGSEDIGVGPDGTSFIVRGMDMHLDYLLAALRRWAVDGRYSGGADAWVDAIQRVRKRRDDTTALVDNWLSAVYGADHPYAHAGIVHVASNLAVEDAESFRAAHFTPDNATLVIAGHVDVALANRWIDYLFADWRGHAEPRRTAAPAPTPASIARIEDLSQLQIRLALPATKGTRAQRLVLAAMVDEIAGDVRHQLGASYGFDASLVENRLASNVMVDGWVEPARATDVVALVRDRLERLRTDNDSAARSFVTARARVIAGLASVTGSASMIAARAETDIELDRAPMSDLATARDVQTLTIEQMAPVLAEVDLARAAILMRGSEEPIKAAFGVLGRQPTIVKVDQAAEDALDDPPTAQTSK
ncbi:MAG TPA: insulinase family protein, partial [Kofleriaceae bacterium]